MPLPEGLMSDQSRNSSQGSFKTTQLIRWYLGMSSLDIVSKPFAPLHLSKGLTWSSTGLIWSEQNDTWKWRNPVGQCRVPLPHTGKKTTSPTTPQTTAYGISPGYMKHHDGSVYLPGVMCAARLGPGDSPVWWVWLFHCLCCLFYCLCSLPARWLSATAMETREPVGHGNTPLTHTV